MCPLFWQSSERKSSRNHQSSMGSSNSGTSGPLSGGPKPKAAPRNRPQDPKSRRGDGPRPPALLGRCPPSRWSAAPPLHLRLEKFAQRYAHVEAEKNSRGTLAVPCWDCWDADCGGNQPVLAGIHQDPCQAFQGRDTSRATFQPFFPGIRPLLEGPKTSPLD